MEKQMKEKDHTWMLLENIQDKECIIAAMQSLYIAVYSLDLITGYYREITAQDYVHGFIKKEGEGFLEVLNQCFKMTSPEWTDILLKFTAKENIVRELADKNVISVEYKSNNRGWCRSSFIVIERDSQLRVTHVLYTTEQIDVMKRKELEYINEIRQKNEALNKQMMLSKSISDVYVDMCYFDIQENDLYRIKDGKMVEVTEFGNVSLNEKFQKTIERKILPDFYKELKTFLDTETMGKRLKEETYIGCDFKSKKGCWLKAGLIKADVDNTGRLKKVLLVIRDATKEKEKELNYQEQLEKTAREAKLANQSKTDFLARMSHDLRTPINVIMGMLEMIDRQREDRQQVDYALDKINVSAQYLLARVNDILEMNRLESGKMLQIEEPFCLSEVLKNCMETIRVELEEKDISFYYEKKGEFSCEDFIGNPTHIRQVFMNIASNAIQYNKVHGSIKAVMEEIARTELEVTIRFTMQDTGVGMSEEFLEEIFEPFSQEKTPEHKQVQGVGLGMAIVKKLVNELHGDIQVESKLNEGTTITVILPFRIDLNAERKKEERERKCIPLEGMRILVVEDTEVNLEIAKFMLESVGIEVDSASNGKIAVEMVKNSDEGYYEMILMDIMMPVMDGWTATKLIRKLDRKDATKMPIIAMSANAFVEDIEKSKEVGMNDHIAKPLNMKNFLECIRKHKKSVEEVSQKNS